MSKKKCTFALAKVKRHRYDYFIAKRERGYYERYEVFR